jgi:hypothetical protein
MGEIAKLRKGNKWLDVLQCLGDFLDEKIGAKWETLIQDDVLKAIYDKPNRVKKTSQKTKMNMTNQMMCILSLIMRIVREYFDFLGQRTLILMIVSIIRSECTRYIFLFLLYYYSFIIKKKY